MVFRILSTGFLELVAEVEWPDPTRARLWAVAEVRERGGHYRALGFRPDGTRAFTEEN